MRIIPAFTVALCLLLGGCLGNPFGSTPAPEEPAPETPLSPVAQFISMNNTGAQASIDDPAFGGGGISNGEVVSDRVPMHGKKHSLRLTLPGLSVMFFRKIGKDRKGKTGE